MAEEVIELSIDETQALRAKLGLPPLRGQGISDSGSGGGGGGDSQQSKTNDSNKDEVVLSIDETNSLRAKIGLPPLNDGITKKAKEGTSTSNAIHVPPSNTYEADQIQKRLEDAAAKRDAAQRIKLLERENNDSKNDDGGGESALDFAAKMMLRGNTNTDAKQAEEGKSATSKKIKKKKRKKKMLSNNPQLSLPAHDEDDENEDVGKTKKEYTSADLHGIKVSHDLSEFESGTTTVLTLADKSILDIDTSTSNKVTKLNDNDQEMNELINVNMDNDKQSLLNLKKKRAIELSSGRAGGYAGYDDDEFDELGGIGPADGSGGMLLSRRTMDGNDGTSTKKGFEIGINGITTNINLETTNNNEKSDLFTSKSINLQSRYTLQVASDFMTSNDMEEEEGKGGTELREKIKLEKERKKQARILDKLRKRKDKKMAKRAKKKKKKKRRRNDDDDDDSDGNGNGIGGEEGGGSLLLANLEATAVGSVKDDNDARKERRRRRHGKDDDDDDDGKGSVDGTNEKREEAKEEEDDNDNDDDVMTEKRKRFDMIMEKGKSRTDRAFNRPSIKQLSSRNNDDKDEDADDDDDAFLNAALAKARRLKRLKELSGSNNDTKVGGMSGNNIKREDAVVQAVARSKQEEEEKAAAREGTTSGANGGKDNGGITFEFDEMQEFTRALRAREDQAKRINNNGKGRGIKATVPGSSSSSSTKDAALKSNVKEEEADGRVEDVDMEELAQEMEDNDNNETNDNEDDDNTDTAGGGAFGNTAESAPIGRGMSNFLSMLKHTGEIKNHATKEEMRGRAKDKRTYEDYEQLDLQKVVNVNTDSHNAHEKDIELANREIKLEYRDDFGRLLTRKEAYRNMCYQFHGHGSSKKNQERRLKQIEREREEGTLASRGTAGVGTLGALKATQKATGKAFIIHKT